MTFVEFLRVLRRRFPLVLVLGIIGLLAGASSAIAGGTSYRYTDRIVIAPNPAGAPQGATGVVRLEDGSIVRTAAEIASGDAVHDAASETAGAPADDSEADAFPIIGSNVVQIEVTAKLRNVANAVGRETSDLTLTKIGELYPAFVASSIMGENPPVEEVPSRALLFAALGLAAGLVAGALAALALTPGSDEEAAYPPRLSPNDAIR